MSQLDDNRIKERDINTRIELGMWGDSINSQQPDGTYPEMWSGTLLTDKEGAFGVANEQSNEICTNLPEGFSVRGLEFFEPKDMFVVFLANEVEGKSEIGFIDKKKCTYTTYCSLDSLGFCDCEWLNMELKYNQPCNQLHVYFSKDDFYRSINLDDNCKKCEENLLLPCHNLPPLEMKITGGVGHSGGLPSGLYAGAYRQGDEDGNKTNWTDISKFKSVGQGTDGDNIPGEPTGKGIVFEAEGLHPDFPFVDFAIWSVVDNIEKLQVVDTTSHSGGKLSYSYFGTTGKEFNLPFNDVLRKRSKYLKGSKLAQYDGRLILYDTIPQFEINVQKYMEDVEFLWQLYAVPIDKAEDFSGYRANEKYLYGLHYNYCDGTHTKNGVGYGPEGNITCDYAESDATVVKEYNKFEHGGVIEVPEIDYNIDDINIDATYDEEGNQIEDNVISDEVIDDVQQESETSLENAANSGGAVNNDTMECMCDLLYSVLDSMTLEGNDGCIWGEEVTVGDTVWNEEPSSFITDYEHVISPLNGEVVKVPVLNRNRALKFRMPGATLGDRFESLTSKDMFELACACDKFIVCTQPNPDFNEEEPESDDNPRCSEEERLYGPDGPKPIIDKFKEALC